MFAIPPWLIVAGAALLGLKLFAPNPRPHRAKPMFNPSAHLLGSPIIKKAGPGDVIQPANASPYNYEPDGNYL